MRKTWLVLFALLFTLPAYAEKITIATTEWTDYTNPDGTGLYYETANAVFNSAEIGVEYVVKPYVRIMEEFLQGEYSGLMGCADTDANKGILVTADWPLEVAVATVLSSSKDPYVSDNSLKGKKIAWIRGYEFEDYLAIPESDYTLHEIPTLEAGMKMMEAGRIDYIIDYTPDLELQIKGHEDKYVLKEAYPENVVMGFPDTPEGKRLLEIWNENMEKLHNSGELNKIFNANGFGDYVKP